MKKQSKIGDIHFLNQRTTEIDSAISRVFGFYSWEPSSEWTGTNGKKDYLLCRVNEKLLIKTIIDRSPHSQKDFYFMDVGAGSFVWLDSLKEFLNENYPSTDKIFHIMGCCAEGGVYKKGSSSMISVQKTTDASCVLYKIGGFKLETIKQELDSMKLDLTDKLDFIVSNFTFRHLVDPIGTFIQVYNLLKPESGFMMTEGMQCSVVNEMEKHIPYTFDNLLEEVGAKLLTIPYSEGRSFDHYLIQKSETSKNIPPLLYKDLLFHSKRSNLSQYDTILEYTGDKFKILKHYFRTLEDGSKFSGEEDMYNWLINNKLFYFQTHNGGKYPVPFIGPIRFDINAELCNILDPVFPDSAKLVKTKTIYYGAKLRKLIVDFRDIEEISEVIYSYLFDCGFTVQEVLKNVLQQAKNSLLKETEATISELIREYLDENSMPIIGALEEAAQYEVI